MPRKNPKYLKKRPRSKWPLLILCLALLLTAGVGVSIARYVTEHNFGGYQQIGTARAYFNSNLLTETGGTTYLLHSSDVTEAEISFDLHNYQGDSASTVDLKYMIYYRISGSSVANQAVSEETGTFTANKEGTTNIITIQLSELGITDTSSSVTVYITAIATSDSGFEKKLYGTFTVASYGVPTISVTDGSGSNSGHIVVNSKGYSGKLTITIPKGYMFDPTDPVVSGTAPITSITINVPLDAEYYIRYFKTNPSSPLTVGNVTLSTTN